jgi:probable blue pigment (indigoidine) exporter
MEDNRAGTAWRWMLVTAIAPVAWGSTYVVTRAVLPAEPLWGAVIRALPAGILLLLLSRRRPRGAWWWRSALLGVLNTGGFFALVYAVAQRLPSGIAATIMAASPLVMMAAARVIAGQRPRLLAVAGGIAGIGGVALMLFGGDGGVDAVGVALAVLALVSSSVGYALATRWSGVDLVASTAWQLLAGGVLLLPVALAVEGAPPALDAPALVGFAYVTVLATGVAFVAWFAGLRHLPAGTVGLIGLLNPVTGVALGALVAGEALTARQLIGLAIVLAGIAVGRVGRGPQSPSDSRKPRVGAKKVVPVMAVEKSRMRS